MAKAIDNSPKADHLMGSLRSMGYSFESAIADIIDNSVRKCWSQGNPYQFPHFRV